MARKTFIGRAFITITGDRKGLDAVLSQVRGAMKKLGQELQQTGLKMMAVGAAIQAPLALAVRQFAKFGDEIAKGAKRAGISTAAYSELAHVAVLSGTSVERFEKALQAMARGMFDAKRGTGEMKDALEVLGLNWQDLEALAPDQRFELIADALTRVSDPSIKAAVAMKIFGKAGAELVPMLALGSEGIRFYREEAQRLGVSLGAEAAGKAERLTDMLARLSAALKGVVMAVGEILAGGFDQFLVYLTNLVTNVREFIQNNPGFVTGLQKAAIALLGVGAAFVGIGKAMEWLSVLVSPGGVLLALAAVLLYISGALDPLIEKWNTVVMNFEIGGRTVRDWLALIGESIGELWRMVKQFFADLAPMLEPVGKAVGAILDSIWQRVKLGFMVLKVWLIDQIQSLIGLIQGALEMAITSGQLGYVAKNAAQGYANLLGRISAGLNSGRATSGGAILEQRQTALQARAGTAAAVTEAAEAVGGAFGAATGGLKGALGALGGRWGDALKPLMATIFGEKGAEGGVKGLLDIFQGLGKAFPEFKAPGAPGAPGLTPALAAGPAMIQAREMVSGGTFSGLGAGFMAAEPPAIRLQKEQLSVLKKIEQNTAHPASLVGDEEY